jgi:hypothetical protein
MALLECDRCKTRSPFNSVLVSTGLKCPCCGSVTATFTVVSARSLRDKKKRPSMAYDEALSLGA